MNIRPTFPVMRELEEYLSKSSNLTFKMGYSLYNAFLISCKM